MQQQKHWWDEDVDAAELHSLVRAQLDTLRTGQNVRIFDGLRFDSLYDNYDYLGISGPYRFQSDKSYMPQITLNALQIIIDTMVSKLVQAQPKVTFVTDGGDWGVRKMAEDLEKVVSGEFYRMKVYEKSETVRRDMCLHGTGFLKFYLAKDHEGTWRPQCERRHPLQLFYDLIEALDGNPRQMYETHFLSRDVAHGTFDGKKKDNADIIDRSSSIASDQLHFHSVGDIMEVIEGWHLPSKPGAKDGKHVIVCEAGVLWEEPWDCDYFPFALARWSPRVRGPYSQGLAEQLVYLQLALNRLMKRIHMCIHLLAAPHFLVEQGSRVVDSHFDTNIGNIIKWMGVKPELVVNKVVPVDLLIEMDRIYKFMYEVSGITGLESRGEKPEGLESAPALGAYTEQTSVRHTRTLKENERFFMRSAEMTLAFIEKAYKANGNKYETLGMHKGRGEYIDYKELKDLSKYDYVMQIAPANILPDTPAGKLDFVERLSQAGVLTPVQAIRALQSPDIAALTQDVTAYEEDIEWTIYEMTKRKGARYMPPEPFQDLESAIPKVQAAYLIERRQGAPKDVLDRLRRWIVDAEMVLQKAAMAEQAESAMLNPPPSQQPMAGGDLPPGTMPPPGAVPGAGLAPPPGAPMPVEIPQPGQLAPQPVG